MSHCPIPWLGFLFCPLLGGQLEEEKCLGLYNLSYKGSDLLHHLASSPRSGLQLSLVSGLSSFATLGLGKMLEDMLGPLQGIGSAAEPFFCVSGQMALLPFASQLSRPRFWNPTPPPLYSR